MKPLLGILAVFALAACKEDLAQLPDPMPLNEDTVAHYCMMNIAEHPGPKAQVFLDGLPDPIFFAQVRDALSYLASAEQDGYVAAFYVSDMSRANWDAPGAGNWILAETAVYVVGSSRMGGMGVPELVPFSDQGAAQSFADTHGGTVHQKTDVPDHAYLAPVEFQPIEEDAS